MRLAFIAVAISVTLYLGYGVVSKAADLQHSRTAQINEVLSQAR